MRIKIYNGNLSEYWCRETNNFMAELETDLVLNDSFFSYGMVERETFQSRSNTRFSVASCKLFY